MVLVSAQLADINSLVAPLEGENQGGDSRAYVRELRTRFSELRNPPICSNPDDPAVSLGQPDPDWQAIRELAIESLRSRTKDLRIACHLAEAEMHIDGLRGLLSGLQLVNTLLQTAWDYLVPEIDPDDPEVRSSPIENLLNDPDRGPCLPQTLKALPIIGQGEAKVSLQDATRRNASEEEKNRVNLAISNCSAEDGRKLLIDCQNIKLQITEITDFLEDKLGESAPSLTNLSNSVEMISGWLTKCFGPIEQQTATVSSNDQATDFEESNAHDGSVCDSQATDVIAPVKPASFSPQDPASVLRLSIQMRNDAYRKLTEAATVLQQIEPHSPIPYMIHRAVRLGQMPFPDLVGKLVREETTLAALRGEFGLSNEDENS